MHPGSLGLLGSIWALTGPLLTLLSLPQTSTALEIDVNSTESIISACKVVAFGLMDYYNGLDYGRPIGMFSDPYYWWEAGSAWNSMIDYWYYTGDSEYNDEIRQALVYQVGDNWDYVPRNQSTTEGNDDQAFWGITVMTAAERRFPDPNPDEPQWLYLAQAVFNTMAWRWDDGYCGGGLRWQIFSWNSGYNYKNTVSNGALFHLGARLARYTHNNTYVEWTEKVWDWLVLHEFVVVDDHWWFVYDGATIEENCSDVVQLQWTYNAGLMISGAAYMYNYTEDPVWLERTEKLLEATTVFFNNSIMYEAACQPVLNCNNDQRSFKAIFSRFLGLTSLMAPSTNSTIRSYLIPSAEAAARSCSGGIDGVTCGLNWFEDGWDGFYGLGEQMSALEVMQNLLVWTKPPPVTAFTGGTSVGSPNAGESLQKNPEPLDLSTKDVVGASIVTAAIGIVLLGGTFWLVK